MRFSVRHYEHGANPLIRQVGRVVNNILNQRGVVTVWASERRSSHGKVCLKMRPRLVQHPGPSGNTAVVLSCTRADAANPLAVAPWTREGSC